MVGTGITDSGHRHERFGHHVQAFVQSLARRGPVPAAGAAAASVVAHGVALALLAVRVSAGHQNPPGKPDLVGAEVRLNALLTEAINMVDEDADAVRQLMGSRRATGGQEDSAGADVAEDRAAASPLRILELAADVMHILPPIQRLISSTVVAELEAAATLLVGGARSAAVIVKQNLAGRMKDCTSSRALAQAKSWSDAVDQDFARLCRTIDIPDSPGK